MYIFSLIVNRVASPWAYFVIVSIEIGRRLICLIDTFIVVKLQRMYKACNRHIFSFHPCCVGLLFFLPSQKAVAHLLVGSRNSITRNFVDVLRLIAHYFSIVRTSAVGLFI